MAAHARRPRRDLRAGRGPHRAPYPVLCWRRRRARARPALRLHPLRLARRCLPAARRRSEGGDWRQGVRRGERARMADDAPDYETELAETPAGGPVGLRRRGIYLLPNLFTTGVLFCGFFAIVQAMNGRFDIGCTAIFVAMVLDAMDGRVARWTNTQSEFGAQYDSIADMVAFGAAPGLIAYVWVLKDLGTLGWIGAFLYCAAAGIRLARFNVNIGVVDSRFFQGLPSPSGAAVLTGLVWVLADFDFQPSFWLAILVWVIAVFAGMTMVSNVPFYSFKEVN